MKIVKRKIAVNDHTEISSHWALPENYDPSSGKGLIIAHGAGSDMHNAFLSYIHESLAEKGLLTVKFNFSYKELGRKAPDRAPLLESTWRAVIHAVRADIELAPKQLYFSGKSMGGRMASHVVAAGEDCNGLIFLGYPLHPPNKTDKLRAEHFKNITCPMLFIQGTRDSLCRLDLLDRVLVNLKAPVTRHIIEGGDHSFNVLKRLGRSEQAVWDEIVTVMFDWIDGAG